MDFPAEYINWI